MDPAVRIAGLDDVARIVELTAQLGYEVSAEAADERLRRILLRPDDRFLVAEHEGTVAGWLHAVVADYLEAGSFVVIAGLVVDRTARKRGIGRALLSGAEQWAIDRGCQLVRLWSSAARTEAHRFYERLGYAHIKTQFSFVKSVGPAAPRDFAAFIPRIDPADETPQMGGRSMNDQSGIIEVVNRYFAALDKRTFDAGTFSSLFADEGTVVRPNGMSVTGPEAIRSSHTTSMERFRATQHLTSGFIIDPVDEATADFRLNLVALHLWKEGFGDASVSRDDNYFLAGGVVSGRAARTGGGWRILTVRNDVIWRKGVGFQEILNTR